MIRASKRAGGAACLTAGKLGWVCVAAALVGTSALAWGAEHPQKQQAQPQPWVTISLKSLGVPSIPTSFLEVGASMLTMDVVDDTHLLVTFSTRGLVPRLPGDPPDDEDRMVAAELVELPTGNVMARTEWHMHDHSRYLWALGKGRFLVRSRHDLFLLTPEARLKSDDPLKRMPFPSREGTPLVAMVSPDKNMVMLETSEPEKKANITPANISPTNGGPANGGPTNVGLVVNEPKPEVFIDFFRLEGGDEPGSVLKVTGAGVARAAAPTLLPMDADGYLWHGDPRRGRWQVTFNEFGGREVKVGAVDSSCQPRLQMVSRFEYLAFTCMGTAERTRMKLYGMDGHETWEDSVGGTFALPAFAYAPAAGRFAMSRIASIGGDTDDLALGNVLPSTATQEVRVYQTESGDLLLKVQTTPVTRFAENFDLSEDGMVAAVVRDGAVEVYKLPPPSKQDVKDLEEARSFSPPASDKPVSFAKLTRDDAAQEDALTGTAEVPMGGGAGSPGAGGASSGGGGASAAAGAGGAADADAGGAGGDAAGAKLTAVSDSGPEGGSAAGAGEVAKAAAGSSEPASGGVGSSAEVQGDGVTQGDGDAAGRRRPPTLLGPGEKVEQVKGSGQASAQPPK